MGNSIDEGLQAADSSKQTRHSPFPQHVSINLTVSLFFMPASWNTSNPNSSQLSTALPVGDILPRRSRVRRLPGKIAALARRSAFVLPGFANANGSRDNNANCSSLA
jgi:hypothetical protein